MPTDSNNEEPLLILGHQGEPVKTFDARVETEDVTLGYAVTVYLYTPQEATVTVIEEIEESEDDDLHSLPPSAIIGRRWDYPFIGGEVGFVLRTEDGRQASCLVRHGLVYQIGGTLRLEYVYSLDEMRRGWKERRRWT